MGRKTTRLRTYLDSLQPLPVARADHDAFFREVNRVTRPAGVSYHLYHNYYSFSGCHLPEFLCQQNPWGHLRGIYQTDPDLNKVTIDRLVELFASSFQVVSVFQVGEDHSKKGVDDGFGYEREDLLTPEIRSELDGFSTEVLLTRSYLVIGKKGERSR